MIVGGLNGRTAAPGWLLVGYTGVAVFLALDVVVRERGSASSLEDSTDDRGTTRVIVGAYGLAAVLPPVLRRLRTGRLPRPAGPAGVAIQVCGLGLRLWSMRTLRASYSRTLRVTDEQTLVEGGPYRFVRHPGYLGSLLTWTGYGITSGSVPAATAVAGLLGAAYGRRIAAEEELLRRDLPGYVRYTGHTKRLVPFVW
ncbi:MAG TPA: isoprenylcysteine carboxylmethyltransferase family protein [Kineosporiaceae bacterium]|nr:isoprenylcysteine carboxylmethyltransferase family protein [Kineosporiaceae bacterium]